MCGSSGRRICSSARRALTGESEPQEKNGEKYHRDERVLRGPDCPVLAFMGSNVISGSAAAVAVSVGDDTLLGETAKRLKVKPAKTTFEKGVNAVSWVLIRFMLVMVPVVLFLNGFSDGNWMDAALFAVSVAVGLTPEMLPMIVTTCLARGSGGHVEGKGNHKKSECDSESGIGRCSLQRTRPER